MANSPDIISNPFSTNIEYISIGEHILKIFQSKWKKFILTFIAVFGAIWTLVNSGSYFLKIDLSGQYFFISLGLISFLSATINSTISYFKTPPSGLEELPYSIQRIVILRRPFWEYEFAYTLLELKLSEVDFHLTGVLSGNVFIEMTTKPKFTEYFKWIQLRPTNILNMVDVALKLLVYELPSSLKQNKDCKISFQNIIVCIERIKDLYQKACEYEIEGRKIKPPEACRQIHEIQSEWSQEIRNGIKKMLELLYMLSRMSKNDLKNPIDFNIKLDKPKGIKEFEIEIQKLNSKLPDLILNEIQEDAF
jgi:hypothetical protein